MHRMTLRVEEAAKLLGMGRCAAYAAVERGEIPSIRFGDFTLVPRAEFMNMLRPSGVTPSANRVETLQDGRMD